MLRYILVFMLALPSSAMAADNWTTADTYREAAFQTLNVVDWGQTRYIAEHPDQFYEVESAWIIGKHPSVEVVDTFMLASAILHPVISYCLPSSWRAAFQYVTIGGKLNNVIGNVSIGIKVSF